ncbi:MAG: M60 family metallopeptidase, partial [Clostridia bacterium]|nr:M60 family metallopeptidase [Clostridia bacterium]
MLYSYDGEKYSTTSQVGFSGKIVATCDRYKPVAEERNESEIFGNVNGYPVYGRNLGAVTGSDPEGTKQAARQRLINEANYLTATGTATAGGGKFTWMDKDGYLYSGTTAAPEKACYEGTEVHRQLYKHTAATGMYGGNVSDSEPGIIKQLTIRPRYYGYNVTGIYAPAGEVIKIEMSGADMRATGGITIHIGQALYNGKNNNIWAAKGAMNRFPMIMNTMSLTTKTTTYNADTDTYTGYVGSFVGGPLYIRNRNVTFNVTISGGVVYRHFILGYTTEKEFEESSKSSAPYFDLEVWDRGVLHSGPLSYAKNFSYQDLYKVAVLWDKVATVTTTNGSAQGIVFLYDPFVAAGAAVAFPGQGSVNCPAGWMSSALNYNAIVTSGSWGNFHEYHHNFQNYGLGSGADGEVTNNG